jgi:hypothetical protein
MYSFTELGDILTVDTATGAATGIGHYDSGATPDNPGPPFTGIFGVVATPEPATLLLCGGGLLIVGWRRRGANAAVRLRRAADL